MGMTSKGTIQNTMDFYFRISSWQLPWNFSLKTTPSSHTVDTLIFLFPSMYLESLFTPLHFCLSFPIRIPSQIGPLTWSMITSFTQPLLSDPAPLKSRVLDAGPTSCKIPWKTVSLSTQTIKPLHLGILGPRTVENVNVACAADFLE